VRGGPDGMMASFLQYGVHGAAPRRIAMHASNARALSLPQRPKSGPPQRANLQVGRYRG